MFLKQLYLKDKNNKMDKKTKILFAILIVMFVLTGFSGLKAEASSCSNLNPCSNGPIVPQQPGGRFLKAGEEDCPSWFPSNFGRACYTMRAVGAHFIPLN